MPKKLMVLLCMLACALGAGAQQPVPAPANANPLSANNQRYYTGIKWMLLRSAEKMPEQHYGFKAADSVRSFGEIVGHLAESQYAFCALVLGEKSPAPKIEPRKNKAELLAALKAALTYCDRAYDGMTDASATEIVRFRGKDTPKLGVLAANNLHSMLHYGNLITYLRQKDVVPPSSEAEIAR